MPSTTDAPFTRTVNQQKDDAEHIDRGTLRACLGRFATGVVVVTYQGPDGPRGITINSFTSVSLDPPLVLISIARSARTHGYLTDQPFAVNVLGADQRPLAERFAGGNPDLDVAWTASRVPALQGCLASLICEPWERFDAGDHSLFVGRVVELDYGDGHALTFHNSRFGTHTDHARDH
jgi:flavin reductase (DIM6/NTAB) family NADH-FMN oxidoreductase RutF